MLKRVLPGSVPTAQPQSRLQPQTIQTSQPSQETQQVLLARQTSKVSFIYQARSREQIKKRATQSGGNIESPIRNDVQLLKIKDGQNNLRVCPPTWENPAHYGFDLHIHYRVGSDNAAFLCLKRMLDKPCPICEERGRAENAGEADYSKELQPTKRVAVWIISRAEEEESPFIWTMPWTVDRDLCASCIDPTTGEVLELDNPDNGYDFSVVKEGTGMKTKYHSIVIGRRSTPISHDPSKMALWLEYIIKNPIPSCLIYRDYDYIEAVFSGVTSRTTADDEPTLSEGQSVSQDTQQQESPVVASPSSGVATNRLQELRTKINT